MSGAQTLPGLRCPVSGPVTAVLCGAGARGHFVYGGYALRHHRRLRFVAEPDPERRRRFQRAHAIPDPLAFERWEDLLAGARRAQAAIVCTPDPVHAAPALRALELGYHLLLEKPLSPRPEECRALAAYPLAEGQVAHVLRYTAFWRQVKQAVAEGRIGRIVRLELSENVSTWHFGHSFVRGAYGVEGLSSPLLLAKCCHDLDLIGWILGEQALSVQSTGALQQRRARSPWLRWPLRLGLRWPLRLGLAFPGAFRVLGAAFPALRPLADWNQFPSTSLGVDLSREGKLRALREGPYGRCVYRCGNDVPDHQEVLLSFPSGATAALGVHGLAEFEGRELRLFGTRGVLRGVFRLHEEELTLTDHRRLATVRLHRGAAAAGHGGGDEGLLDAFTSALGGRPAPAVQEAPAEQAGLSGPAQALESHLLAFAAEAARRLGAAVSMEEYRRPPGN